MTRSRARENPDQYTVVPAPIKIIKVLVEELLSASGSTRSVDGTNAADIAGRGEDGTGSTGAGGEGSSDEDDWEDEPGAVLDLGLGTTKQGAFFVLLQQQDVY